MICCDAGLRKFGDPFPYHIRTTRCDMLREERLGQCKKDGILLFRKTQEGFDVARETFDLDEFCDQFIDMKHCWWGPNGDTIETGPPTTTTTLGLASEKSFQNLPSDMA